MEELNKSMDRKTMIALVKEFDENEEKIRLYEKSVEELTEEEVNNYYKMVSRNKEIKQIFSEWEGIRL